MVHFGQNFRQAIHSNWLQYCIDYDKLKRLVFDADSAVFEKAFVWEVRRCNTFLVQRAGKIQRQLTHLRRVHENVDAVEIPQAGEHK